MEKRWEILHENLVEVFGRRKAWYSAEDAMRLTGGDMNELLGLVADQSLEITLKNDVAGFPWSELATVFLDHYSISQIEEVLGPDAEILPPLLRGHELTIRVREYRFVLIREIATKKGIRIEDVIDDALGFLDGGPEDTELKGTVQGYAEAANFPNE